MSSIQKATEYRGTFFMFFFICLFIAKIACVGLSSLECTTETPRQNTAGAIPIQCHRTSVPSNEPDGIDPSFSQLFGRSDSGMSAFWIPLYLQDPAYLGTFYPIQYVDQRGSSL
ncbi:uncharacterized protein BT62DRAFT_921652 [Guyanagaster necrorhizus]|uniref:Uncharacterized protein n=1 Tax=Guyanagaster necrorhizus TaxID=856835 RepID=A0A9P8AQI9_9AGAR|nr:uncharacterized protein BT62DRAFT_921652 [Guyanagaster necrorhizus MCA 3950]KAG7444035.1 hypothetical protein BT62DRAFT_921652 [Guyanagaster necrorhizus MCA 3950]